MGRWKNCFWIFLSCLTVSSLAGITDIGNLKTRADQGDTVAQEAIGRYYDGSHQYADAYHWYLKAAQAGRAESQYRLGLIQLQGKPGLREGESPFPANPERAIHWLTTSAGQDHPGAQAQLGKCYAEGIGVRKDPVEAYKWSLVAAEKMAAYSEQANELAIQLTSDQIRRGKEAAATYLGVLPERQPRTTTAQVSGSNNLAGTPKPAAFSEKPGIRTASPSTPPPNDPAPKTEGPGLVRFIAQIITKIAIVVLGFSFVVVITKIALRQRKQAGTASRNSTVPRNSRNSTTSAPSKGAKDPLQNLDRIQFEKLMELIYKREGFRVERPGSANPDSGIDLVLTYDIERIAVQCKHWTSRKVGVESVRQFFVAMSAEGIDSGIFASSNGVSRDAKKFAAKNGIKLIDGKGLNSLMARYDAAYDAEFRAILERTEKRCPKCDSKMVERVVSEGVNIGQKFWGCSTFPRCRYVMKSDNVFHEKRELANVPA